MSLIIVPDTHVLISGGTISSSYTGQIISSWRKGTIDIATSDPILREVRQVLDYPAIEKINHWKSEDKDGFIRDLRGSAILAAGNSSVSISKDPKDDIFFACALEVGAEYIVSKDRHLLDVESYFGTVVVKPGYFVEQVLRKIKI